MKMNYYRLRRDAWFNEKVCAKCGSTENLELDHRDPATKSVSSQKVWFLPEAERLVELAKCQALCRKCHREKTGREVSEKHRTGQLISPFTRNPELARVFGAKGGKAAAPNNPFVRSPEYASQCGRLGGRPRKLAVRS